MVTGLPLSEGGIRNIAAHAAVLSQPDQVLANYKNITTELATSTSSMTLENLLKTNALLDKTSNYAQLQAILADPNISTDVKVAAWDSNSAINNSASERPLSSIVGQQAAMEPFGPGETDEVTDTTTIDIGAILDERDLYNAQIEDLKNSNFNLKDRSFVDTSLDVLEMMFPFMETLATAKTRLANGEDAMKVMSTVALTGENYQAAYENLRKAPLETRRDLAVKLVDMIKKSGGSVLPRQNQLLALKQLDEFINGGTGGDRVLDNIFAVVDLVPFVGGIFKMFKGSAAAVKGAADLERAAMVEQRLAEAVQVVDEVAPIPRAPLDNIIEGSKGFDKASADEIANARNAIGYGLDDGKTADEVMAASAVFDKFTRQELDEFRAIYSTPAARETAPLSDDVVNSVKQAVGDNVINTLKELDEVPYDKIVELRRQVEDVVNRASVLDTKKLSKDILATTRKYLRSSGLGPVDKSVADVLRKRLQLESEAARLSGRTSVDLNSVSQTFAASNAGKARNLNNLMEADQTGDIARATYGTERNDAIAFDRGPEVANVDGSVRSKPIMDEAGPKPDENVVRSIFEEKGYIHLDQKEKALMQNAAKEFFNNVHGLVTRSSMNTIDDTASGVRFDMVYGPKDGGFKNARQGVEQVLRGLANYGVLDKEIEVLKLGSSGKYEVVAGLPVEDGNYLVRVKHDYTFTPGDVVSYSMLGNSKYTMFDMRNSLTSESQGSIAQHVIPASAVINKVIYNSASAASDAVAKIVKRLLKVENEFVTRYKKLSKEEKAVVDNYRVEANEKQLPFSFTNLKARGMSDESIDALRSWKTATDTIWYLENVDFNKTLRARGWQRFTDQATDTDLIAREASKSSVSSGVKAFDSTTGEIVELTGKQVDELYKKGGSIAEIKGTQELGDDTFDFLVVHNGEGGYLRRVRDEDASLPYRDGYYPVRYDAPVFIKKQFRKKDGSTYWKAIGTVANLRDAEQTLKRLRANDTSGTYKPFADYKRGTQDFDDAQWESVVSSGRSAQRVRGQRLHDFSGELGIENKFMEGPEEALTRTIRSIASRTAFRDWLETTKSRWLDQNKDLVDRNQWPTDVRQVGSGNLEASSARVKDAKATWRYVSAMENGYVNIIDDFSKAFFNNIADIGSRKGWGWMEKAGSAASTASPLGSARRMAFRLLLASNPLRQLPVQALQALPVLLATNPLAIPKISMQMILLDFMATGGDALTFMKTLGKTATGMNVEDAKLLSKHWEASGFEAAVDANSLIRDQISSLIDRSWWGKTKKVVGAPLNFVQKIGFNQGEKILMRSVWLSEYDLLLKSGVKIDAATLENLNARVRNLTLNMNRAGEMPYNENTLSAAMQFFQAPHKAFAQILLGHTGLTGAERFKLGASYVLTYGVGSGWVSDMIMKGFDSKDEGTRELVEGGLFNLTLNSALSTLFKEEVKTDFSDSLRLIQAPDVFKFWNGLMTAQVGEVLSGSPSVGLVFGDSPRLTTFVKQIMRPFTVDDTRKPEEFALLGKNFLQLFSGASNFFKAQYIMEHQKSMNSKGAIVDYHVGNIEAFLQVAGFKTIDEIQEYASNEAVYRSTDAYKKDITLIVDETTKRLAAQGVSNEEAGWYVSMMSEAQRVFKNDPFYMKEFSNAIAFKAKAGENDLYNRLRTMAGFTEVDEFIGLVDKSNLPENMKGTLRQMKKIIGEPK
jgi:hypothetical protein